MAWCEPVLLGERNAVSAERNSATALIVNSASSASSPKWASAEACLRSAFACHGRYLRTLQLYLHAPLQGNKIRVMQGFKCGATAGRGVTQLPSLNSAQATEAAFPQPQGQDSLMLASLCPARSSCEAAAHYWETSRLFQAHTGTWLPSLRAKITGAGGRTLVHVLCPVPAKECQPNASSKPLCRALSAEPRRIWSPSHNICARYTTAPTHLASSSERNAWFCRANERAQRPGRPRG